MKSTNEQRFEAAEALLGDWLAKREAEGTQSTGHLASLIAQRPDLEHELRNLWSQCGLVDEAFAADAARHAEQLARVKSILDDLRRPTGFNERYEVQSEIGRGGMGAVLRVIDRKLDRPLAMKVIVGQASAARTGETPPVEPRQLARFLNEARITGQLDHPGIVPVHEVGVDVEGRAYFTMKLVKGQTLAEVFDKQAAGDPNWSMSRVLTVIERVCEAMAFSHEREVIHRDLKPANIMVGDFGEVYVMDWGLARKLGEAEEIGSATTEIDAELGAQLSLTREGAVLGTPAYMSPEQARGEIATMGPQSDVYSLGAMLYQLIAGTPPHVRKGEKPSGQVVLARVVSGSPRRLDSPTTPPELIAICEKAMAQSPAERYGSVRELARDLNRFVTGRTVRAFDTGPWAETKKWIKRNKALAVALAAVVQVSVIGGVAFAVKAADERKAKLDVLALSAQREVDSLVERAEQLWPARPERVEELEAWLADAARARDGDEEADRPSLAEHRHRLERLRLAAPPDSEADVRARRAQHPRAGEAEKLRAELLWRSRMLGDSPWPEDATAEREARDLVAASGAAKPEDLSFGLVAPDEPHWGREHVALVLARDAVARSQGVPNATAVRALCWALFRCGRLDEATSASDLYDALPASGELRRDRYALGYAVDQWRRQNWSERRVESAQLAEQIAALDALMSERRSFAYVDTRDAWWDDQLSKLIRDLEALFEPRSGLVGRTRAAPFGWGIEERLEFARSIAERSVRGAAVEELWALAAREIAASPHYGGLTIAPQIGLVPLGPDPRSGLWEFAHLASGEVPSRSDSGELELRPDSGIVLVLVPGGDFEMGVSASDSLLAEGDGEARAISAAAPRHPVTLAPYFLAKYELTQSQWLRCAGDRPSARYAWLWSDDGERLDPSLRPVEMVSQHRARLVLQRMDLELPTEAQWEYAARAGTETVWWTGDDPQPLTQAANLGGDQDGAAEHTVVGSYAPNAFGLHDTIGNVWEWCSDKYASYSRTPRVGDGLRGDESLTTPNAIARGGSWSDSAFWSRSAMRYILSPDHRRNDHGLRAARRVDP